MTSSLGGRYNLFIDIYTISGQPCLDLNMRPHTQRELYFKIISNILFVMVWKIAPLTSAA